MGNLRWMCQRCGTPNMPERDVCFRCYAVRPIAPPTNPTLLMDRQAYARRSDRSIKTVAIACALAATFVLAMVGVGMLNVQLNRRAYGVSTAPTPLTNGPSSPSSAIPAGREMQAEIRWYAPGAGSIRNMGDRVLAEAQVRAVGVETTGQGGFTTGLRRVNYLASFQGADAPPDATPLQRAMGPAQVSSVTLQPGESKGFYLPQAGSHFPPDIQVIAGGRPVPFTQLPPPSASDPNGPHAVPSAPVQPGPTTPPSSAFRL